jgi:ribosome-associated protein
VAIALARLAADTRCHNVVVMDVRHLSPVTDFFILGTGTSPRQMRTVADDVIEAAEAKGYKAMSASGYEGSNWICVDLINIVLHVFSDEARVFYDLDNLWAEAERIEVTPTPTTQA